MSHEIEEVEGVASMAYAGETPWHGLGKRVHNDLTVEQMLTEAGLDWTVELHKVSAKIDVAAEIEALDPEGRAKAKAAKKKYIPTIAQVTKIVEVFAGDKRMLVRRSATNPAKDMTYLTMAGKNWNPVQNSEAFSLFHDFVMAGDMEMHTAGSLKDGLFTWCLAKVKSDFTLWKRDRIESYLLLTNPHVYGEPLSAKHTATRVVCWNTMSEALSSAALNGASATITHRKKFDAEKVKEMLGIAKHQLEAYREKAEFLGSKRYTEETIKQYVSDVFPASNEERIEAGKLSRSAVKILGLVSTQPGADIQEGSWWQAFNAVTFGVDHVLGKSQDSRLISAWYGGGKNKKDLALSKAVEYATAS